MSSMSEKRATTDSASECGLADDASAYDLFKLARRPAYLQLDLDTLTNNIAILRRLCKNRKAGVMAVVKAGAYGHGSVGVSLHLKRIGVERLAVATVSEARCLRDHDVTGPIHVLGNVLDWEIEDCLANDLIPTICCEPPIRAMYEASRKDDKNIDARHQSTVQNGDVSTRGTVHIKVDTGMSRNGCQPEELAGLVALCDELGVRLEGIFTHFADAMLNPDFTKQQLDVFHRAVDPFRHRGFLLHASNSAAILSGVATDLDFIRPGIAMYGLPPELTTTEVISAGLRPFASVRAVPTLVKLLPAGRKLGYGGSYETRTAEWIATFALGYSDGYWRQLRKGAEIVRDATGEHCPVVGGVAMDALLVRLPCRPQPTETFTVMTADYDDQTSAFAIASKIGTIAYEVVTRLSTRYPRLYFANGKCTIYHSTTSDAY